MLLVVTAVVAATMAAAGMVLTDTAREASRTGMERTRRLVRELGEGRRNALRSQARLLAQEPRLRAVIATPDAATVSDVAGELARAAGNDVFMALDADGRVVAAAPRAELIGRDLSRQPLVAAALRNGDARGSWLLDDQPYDAAVERLDFGNTTVGALLIGQRLSDMVLRRAAQTTASIVVVASHGKLLAAATPHGTPPSATLNGGTLELDGETHALVAVEGEGNDDVTLLIGEEVDTAAAVGHRALLTFALIGCSALLLAIISGALVASGVARAFERLSIFGERMALGELSQPPPSSFAEVKSLSASFTKLAERQRTRRAFGSGNHFPITSEPSVPTSGDPRTPSGVLPWSSKSGS